MFHAFTSNFSLWFGLVCWKPNFSTWFFLSKTGRQYQIKLIVGKNLALLRLCNLYFFNVFVMPMLISGRSTLVWNLDAQSVIQILNCLYPHIYLHSVFAILQFDIASLVNLIFNLCISNLNLTGYSRQKNPVQTRKNLSHQTRYFKLGNHKNQMQIWAMIPW